VGFLSGLATCSSSNFALLWSRLKSKQLAYRKRGVGGWGRSWGQRELFFLVQSKLPAVQAFSNSKIM
jgi:hypothetical protein